MSGEVSLRSNWCFKVRKGECSADLLVAIEWRGAENVISCVCDTRLARRTAKRTCIGDWCAQCVAGVRWCRRRLHNSVSSMLRGARERRCWDARSLGEHVPKATPANHRRRCRAAPGRQLSTRTSPSLRGASRSQPSTAHRPTRPDPAGTTSNPANRQNVVPTLALWSLIYGTSHPRTVEVGLIALAILIGGIRRAGRRRIGNLPILRFTPRALRWPRLETTRSCKIFWSTHS